MVLWGGIKTSNVEYYGIQYAADRTRYKVPQIHRPVAMYFKSDKRVRQAARSFQNTFIVRHKSRNEPNLIYFKKMP